MRFIYFIFLLASLLGLQCKSTLHSTAQKASYKSIYIDQFKLTYFKKILIKSYNNSKAIQEIIHADHSGFTEPLLTEDDYKLIDSLTTADNENLKIDSTEGNRRAEGAQGKRPLGFILDRFKTQEIDRIAKKRYKISGLNKIQTD